MSSSPGSRHADAGSVPAYLRRGVRLIAWAALVGVSTPIMGCSVAPSASDRFLAHADAAGTTCAVIVRDGDRIAGIGDEVKAPVRAFSITKSVTSLLVGIAQDAGHLSLTDPVSLHVPQWQSTASSDVTIRDILTNTSGREWDARTDYRDMAFSAADKTSFALSLGQETEPGADWVYNNSAVQVLEEVLENATDTPVHQFADTALFGPLGMTDTVIEQDDAGNTNLFAGLRTTCADLVRLGELMLDQGVADAGRRVISDEYIGLATAESSTEHNAAYGMLWWLNQPGPAETPEIATTGRGGPTEGPLVPDAPPDTFWALGLHDQILMVVPSLDAVAVRLGGTPPTDSTYSMRTFSTDVLQVLEEVP